MWVCVCRKRGGKGFFCVCVRERERESATQIGEKLVNKHTSSTCRHPDFRKNLCTNAHYMHLNIYRSLTAMFSLPGSKLPHTHTKASKITTFNNVCTFQSPKNPKHDPILQKFSTMQDFRRASIGSDPGSGWVQVMIRVRIRVRVGFSL